MSSTIGPPEESESGSETYQPCLGTHAQLGVSAFTVGFGSRKGDIEFGSGALEGMATQQEQAELALTFGEQRERLGFLVAGS